MNTLYVKKKVMRMRLESQSIFGNMESGQPAVLPVEEVIPHFLFLLIFDFATGQFHFCFKLPEQCSISLRGKVLLAFSEKAYIVIYFGFKIK